jgi:hypothetical protein
MNMLDMHTREKANKIHLDEMHRDARHRYLLGCMNSVRNLAISRRIRLVLIFAALIILLGAFLITSIGGF